METRRIVISLSHENQATTEGPWTFFIPMTDAYCKANKIQFECVTIKKDPEDRSFSWAKVPVIAKYYQSYDEVLLIYNNSTIINMNINIFDYLKTAPECTKWIRDKSITPIIYALSDKSSNECPLSDILLIDCSNKEAVKQFLNDWWNEIPHPCYKRNTPFENATFISWKQNSKKAALFRIADIWSQDYKDPNQVFITITDSIRSIQIYEAKKYMYRLLHQKRAKIGIFVRQSNYYASGAGQNCIFIKHSLEAAGYDVDLLVDYSPTKPNMVDSQIPYMYTSVSNVDLSQYSFILYGSSISSPETRQKIRNLGIRTAVFHPMNSLDGIHNNHFIYNESTSIPLFEETFHTIADEIWLTSNHEATYKMMLEIQNKHKIPIRTVPLTWSPLFTLTNGVQYKYEHHTKANTMNIIIMEPNTSYCKNALMPLVIAEAFYMKHKEKINKVYLFGSVSNEANNIINMLSLAKDSKLRKIGRMPVNDIIKFFCFTEPNHKIAVISHNIQIPLNYAYYDVMNAGMPFIHNSDSLHSNHMGYYYNTVTEGVTHLESIFTSFDASKYTDVIQNELALINPYNDQIIKTFIHAVSNAKVHTTIVSTLNKERKEFMEDQLKSIQFPYPYTFFKSYTAHDSQDYLDVKQDCILDSDKHRRCVFTEDQSYALKCGLRSHIAALHECLKSTAADYFLIMEDDISLRTDINIQSAINTYIQFLETHPNIHYISLAYRPFMENKLIHEVLDKKDALKDVYWNIPDIWGAQAYLISRKHAQSFVSLLHVDTLSTFIKQFQTYYSSNTTYSTRGPQLIIDSVLPIVLKQAIVHPMLAIEKTFSHAITSSNALKIETDKYYASVNINYYKYNG